MTSFKHVSQNRKKKNKTGEKSIHGCVFLRLKQMGLNYVTTPIHNFQERNKNYKYQKELSVTRGSY